MIEYRIAESIRRFWIEVRHDGKEWHDLSAIPRVPRFFDSLADARSWVATIKRGVVYHDAEDAPNLARDERKAEDDTSDGYKSLEWFEERIGKSISRNQIVKALVFNDRDAMHLFDNQKKWGFRYFDPR